MSSREEVDGESTRLIEDEIHDLEEQLTRARTRLASRTAGARNGKPHDEKNVNGYHQPPPTASPVSRSESSNPQD